MREVNTRVFPDPGPATTLVIEFSGIVTALDCDLFKSRHIRSSSVFALSPSTMGEIFVDRFKSWLSEFFWDSRSNMNCVQLAPFRRKPEYAVGGENGDPHFKIPTNIIGANFSNNQRFILVETFKRAHIQPREVR